MHVCFYGLVRLWLVSHNEMSIVIISTLQQPSSALWLRFAPTETLMEQHSSPSCSSWPHIAVAHLSDPLTVSMQADVLTSPAPALASCAQPLCNIFILAWHGCNFKRYDRSTSGSCSVFASVREKCYYASEQGTFPERQKVQLSVQMREWEEEDGISGWKCSQSNADPY